MRYLTIKIILCSVIVAYLLVGFGVRIITAGERAENVYPFFSWSLFAWIPQRVQTNFMIQIHRIDGRDTPVDQFLLDMPSLYRASGRSRGDIHESIQRSVSRFVSDGDEATLERSLSFVPVPVEYEVVEVMYHPVEYWMKGSVIEQRSRSGILRYEP